MSSLLSQSLIKDKARSRGGQLDNLTVGIIGVNMFEIDLVHHGRHTQPGACQFFSPFELGQLIRNANMK